MKVAVLSDIHGNLPALRAVVDDIDRWEPEVVIVDGDVVNRGPLSGACLDLLRERLDNAGWILLRGNHEEFVLDCGNPDAPLSGPPYETTQFAHFALAQLNGHIEWLRALPDIYECTSPDGHVLRVAHASMRSNRDGIYPVTSDDEVREQIAPAPAVFVTGHTHRPLTRQVDGTLVINVGSVGAPFDHDRRASYGRFVWANSQWSGEVTRLDYDYCQIELDYAQSGFLDEGGPLAQLMLVELRMARGLIFRWASRYELAVLNGLLSLEESVRLVLCDEDVRPYTGPPVWSL